MTVIEYAGLTASAVMLAATAWLVSQRAAPGAPDRYWFMIMAAVLQVVMYSLILSWLNALSAGPLLALQAAVLIAVAVGKWLLPGGRDGGTVRPLLPAARGGIGGRTHVWVRDRISLALLAGITFFIALSAAQHCLTPIWAFDDRMYHGPRALYWIQNRSILPFETHNDRQTVFPFLAELFFAWTLIFVKHELPARLAFWLVLPATTAGVYLLAREVRAPRRLALAAALLFVSTPTVLRWTVTLKADAWQPLMAIGAAYFVCRGLGSLRRTDREPARRAEAHWLMTGLYAAAALAIKTTSLALVPGLAVAAFAAGWSVSARLGARAVAWLCVGLVAGSLLTGFASLLWWNARDHGHPMGPRGLSQLVRADLTPVQLRTHAARVPLYLLEVPYTPETPGRWLQRRKEGIARITGADRRLDLEQEERWPWVFQTGMPSKSRLYSLGGLLWLPLLAVGLVRAGREMFQRWDGGRIRLSRITTLVIVQIPLFVGVTMAIRWMWLGPDRFWLAAYALVLPVVAYFFGLWMRRSRTARVAAAGLLVWAIAPAAYLQARLVVDAVRRPISLEQVDEPYQHVVPHLGRGDIVLLFALHSSRDYPLFGPREGFSRRIVPWGKHEFDEQLFREVLGREEITHIVFQDARAIGFRWAGFIRTSPFAEWLDDAPEFERVPLEVAESDPRMRLYRRVD